MSREPSKKIEIAGLEVEWSMVALNRMEFSELRLKDGVVAANVSPPAAMSKCSG
ncbi:MAG: hypothetical protein MUE46_18455 [Xanthomonadales bacterium]|jgi:hypothetical protein|nr:hypothetical protein [Xanthomonadales bacterium]